MRIDPTFGFAVPLQIEGVPDRVLDPRAGWADGTAYDQAARRLSEMFAVAKAKLQRPEAVAAE
jgi:phosphoenolpyruvate carboxykinase (ATP)